MTHTLQHFVDLSTQCCGQIFTQICGVPRQDGCALCNIFVYVSTHRHGKNDPTMDCGFVGAEQVAAVGGVVGCCHFIVLLNSTKFVA